jgi:selenocysteine lyase/cysteine desulfurase
MVGGKMSAVLQTETFDTAQIRKDFPILAAEVHGRKLVFLDSAASAQKPRAVIDAMVFAMEHQYANVHRGLHWMSERTSDAYEAVRDKVAGLINAAEREEIVFTRNATESINLVAYTYGRTSLQTGDAIVVSEMEHHANLVPWQMLRDAHGVELRIVKITDAGEVDFESRMSGVLKSCWMAARQSCTGRWMCRRSMPISTYFPAISFTALPVSACCTPSARYWIPCRRSWAAGI